MRKRTTYKPSRPDIRSLLSQVLHGFEAVKLNLLLQALHSMLWYSHHDTGQKPCLNPTAQASNGAMLAQFCMLQAFLLRHAFRQQPFNCSLLGLAMLQAYICSILLANIAEIYCFGLMCREHFCISICSGNWNRQFSFKDRCEEAARASVTLVFSLLSCFAALIWTAVEHLAAFGCCWQHDCLLAALLVRHLPCPHLHLQQPLRSHVTMSSRSATCMQIATDSSVQTDGCLLAALLSKHLARPHLPLQQARKITLTRNSLPNSVHAQRSPLQPGWLHMREPGDHSKAPQAGWHMTCVPGHGPAIVCLTWRHRREPLS